MTIRRVVLIGALTLLLALLAVASLQATAQESFHNIRTIPANDYIEVDLGYLEYDTEITIDLHSATQPVILYVYSEDYYYDTTRAKSSDIRFQVHNVQSGNWTVTVHANRDYYVVFENDHPEPTTLEYTITVDEEVINTSAMIWPIFGTLICITCITIAIPLLMMLAMVIIIIIVIKYATKDDKKKQHPHHRTRPPQQGEYVGPPGYYPETPRKKKKGKKKEQ